MPFRATNLVHPLLVAFAILGGLCSTATPAPASCGDFPTINGSAPPDVDLDDGEPSSKAPCRGPDCSLGRAPDQSLIGTAPVRVSEPRIDPAALDTRAGDAASASASWQRVAPRLATVTRPFAPFHPPKSV